MAWKPIKSAPKTEGCAPIYLAHFQAKEIWPTYVVIARWGTDMPGYIHCASYSGWFVDGIPLEDPPRRKGVNNYHGILPRAEYAPTHWDWVKPL